MKKCFIFTAVMVLLLSPVLLCRPTTAMEPVSAYTGAEKIQEGMLTARTETKEVRQDTQAVQGRAQETSSRKITGIQGDEGLQIAIQGESLAIIRTGAGYQLLPLDEKGVYLDTESGRLIATPDAEEGIVTVIAQSEKDGSLLRHDVQLYRSWRLGSDIIDIAKFPEPGTVKKPETEWLRFFSAGKMTAARVGLLAAALLPGILYAWLRKQGKDQLFLKKEGE